MLAVTAGHCVSRLQSCMCPELIGGFSRCFLLKSSGLYLVKEFVIFNSITKLDIKNLFAPMCVLKDKATLILETALSRVPWPQSVSVAARLQTAHELCPVGCGR